MLAKHPDANQPNHSRLEQSMFIDSRGSVDPRAMTSSASIEPHSK
jgi:hypothetical protein